MNEVWGKYIDERNQFMGEDILNSEKRIVQYLILVNAGGAAAVLAFLSNREPEDVNWGPKLTLVCFALGLIAVGLLLAKAQQYLVAARKKWNEDLALFYDELLKKGPEEHQKAFDELVNKAMKTFTEPSSLERFGWWSFRLFIAGTIVGGIGILFA